MKLKLSFGRYRGKDIHEVDDLYLRWLISTTAPQVTAQVRASAQVEWARRRQEVAPRAITTPQTLNDAICWLRAHGAEALGWLGDELLWACDPVQATAEVRAVVADAKAYTLACVRECDEADLSKLSKRRKP